MYVSGFAMIPAQNMEFFLRISFVSMEPRNHRRFRNHCGAWVLLYTDTSHLNAFAASRMTHSQTRKLMNHAEALIGQRKAQYFLAAAAAILDNAGITHNDEDDKDGYASRRPMMIMRRMMMIIRISRADGQRFLSPHPTAALATVT